MPRLDKETRERIRQLEPKELQEIVLKLASKEKSVYDFVVINYLDKEFGETDLFERTKAELETTFYKSHKGYSEELRLANKLAACMKKINEFTKSCSNKKLEADLLLYLLDFPFSLTSDLFGTCFTQYDTKVATILKRLISIVNNKLHEDYKADYREAINVYLNILHRYSNHIETVHCLPKSL